MDLGLDGRVALITGSSAGIGFATAEALAAEGARVVLCARRRERLDAAAKELASRYDIDPPEVVVADMATTAGPTTAVEFTVATHGRIDILVNNATDVPVGSILTFEPGEVEEALRAKPIGYVRACVAAVPAMRRNGRGVIVNVAGISSRSVSPTPRTTIETTAVIGLTKALSEEVAHDGIRVVAVSPGAIRTPHLDDNFARFARGSARTEQEVEREMTTQIPLARFGEPQDVADAIAFLCSDRASYITGAALVVDGGKSRAIT